MMRKFPQILAVVLAIAILICPAINLTPIANTSANNYSISYDKDNSVVTVNVSVADGFIAALVRLSVVGYTINEDTKISVSAAVPTDSSVTDLSVAVHDSDIVGGVLSILITDADNEKARLISSATISIPVIRDETVTEKVGITLSYIQAADGGEYDVNNNVLRSEELIVFPHVDNAENGAINLEAAAAAGMALTVADVAPHECVANSYVANEDGMTHKVLCECGEVIEESVSHVFDDDADTDCNFCDFTREVEPPVHVHTPVSSVVNNATVTTCSECGETLASSLFSGVGLNITGSINLYLDGKYSGDYIKEYGFMVWKYTDTPGAKEDAVLLTDGTLYGESYRFYFTDIKAKELADNLYVCPFVILEDDTFVQGYGVSYSVRKYCSNKYKSATETQKLKNLCIALANYGAASQIAFKYRQDDLANDFLAEADKTFVYSGTAFDAFSMDKTNATTSATFSSMALNLVDVFRIRYDVKMNNDTIDNATLLVWSKETFEALDEHTIDNAEVKINMADSLVSAKEDEDLERKREGCYTIQTASGQYSIYGQAIKAQNASDVFYSCLAVKQSDGSYKYSLTFTYGIETYCARNIKGTVSAPQETIDQCGALMNYYAATKAYFG